jgi:hypothetical protein
LKIRDDILGGWWKSLGVYNKIILIMRIAFALIIAPILIIQWGNWAKNANLVWIGFWGNILGGFISGALTLIGVRMTIGFSKEKGKQRIRPYYIELKRILDNLVQQLENVIRKRKTNNSVDNLMECALISKSSFSEFINAVESLGTLYERQVPELNRIVHSLADLMKQYKRVLKDELVLDELDNHFFYKHYKYQRYV